MYWRSFIVAIALSAVFVAGAKAQQTVSLLKGMVKDASTGKAVPSATATIYMGKDSLVLKYAFTSNSGLFKFENLPVDTTILIIISHLSYNSYEHSFRLKKDNPTLELNTIVLSERSSDLREVKITGQRPPLFMKGDTLVVNPEAIKTKENAVVEDVLRKVPGIVVWADGKISVNGKPVSQLMVAGKPFFGGDPVVAIRNLPKEAIDQIKVYDDKYIEAEAERTVTMDITFKNGIKAGVFGKAGGGLGTDERHEGNIALNAFTAKNQISVMAVTNNTNKEIYNVQSMLKQTVYKPGGNDNTSYQSNFGMEGLNDFKAGGMNFQRNWTKTMNSGAEYFNYATNNQTDKNIEQVTRLTDGFLQKNSIENREGSKHRQFLNTVLSEIKPEYEFRLEPKLEKEKNNYLNLNESFTKNQDGESVNQNFSRNQSASDAQTLNLSAEFIKKDKSDLNQQYLLRYQIYANTYSGDEELHSMFNSFGSVPNPEVTINRKTDKSLSTSNQSLFGEVDLKSLFKTRGKLWYKLMNTFSYVNQDNDQVVWRYNEGSNSFDQRDLYLTNKSEYHLFQGRPGFRIGRTTYREGVRNKKLFIWSALAEMQYLNQDHQSQKVFQQINRDYAFFLPSLNVRYNHKKEGKFDKTYSVNYNTRAEIPTIEQLAPLVDSANQYFIAMGNPNLKRQYTNEFVFNYQNYKPRGTGVIRFELKMGIVDDKLADSSIYDAAGRQLSYTVNANGFKYLNASGSYERSGKLFNNPVGLKLFPRFNISENPYYINGESKTSKNLNATLMGIFNYVQNDLLLYDLITNFSLYRNVIDERKLQSVRLSAGGSIQLSWPKHTTLVNSLSYEVNSNTYTKKLETFIWNANLYYRLLKKEQLELKLTATDLLRQRSNFIRYLDNNVLGNGTVNNLQQFFMIGLSYYPRQFGSKK